MERKRGRGGGYHGPVRRPRMQNSRKQFSRGVWVPAIPSWEKDFCYEIGLFTWENFVEAKRNAIGSSEKVMDWDDSGAKEAFHSAKNLFFAKKFNGIDANNYSLPSPDLYIDEINWDDGREENIPDRELEDARVGSEDDDDGDVQEEKEVECYDIPIDNIKPTGWGDDDDGVEVYFSSGKVLVGLIIGN